MIVILIIIIIITTIIIKNKHNINDNDSKCNDSHTNATPGLRYPSVCFRGPARRPSGSRGLRSKRRVEVEIISKPSCRNSRAAGQGGRLWACPRVWLSARLLVLSSLSPAGILTLRIIQFLNKQGNIHIQGLPFYVRSVALLWRSFR